VMSKRKESGESDDKTTDKKRKEGKLQVVDPHMHFWTAETHAWIPKSNWQHPYLIEHYEKDIKSAGVDVVKCVNIQANGNDPVEETKWLQGLADKHGFPQGIIGFADLGASESEAEAQLQGQLKFKNFRGIRFMLDWHKTNEKLRQTTRSDWLTDEKWLKNFGLLEKYNLIFDLQLHVWQLADAAKLAGKYPKVQIILNHTGLPYGSTEEEFDAWKAGMTLLAKQSNVAAKVSGFSMCDSKFTAASIKRHVLTTIELFGVPRTMFATNFPVDKEHASMEKIWKAFEEIVDGMEPKLTEANKAALFQDNALRFYKI